MAFKLTHPDSTQEIEVDAEMVAAYTTQGWEAVPTAKDHPEPVATSSTDRKKA